MSTTQHERLAAKPRLRGGSGIVQRERWTAETEDERESPTAADEHQVASTRDCNVTGRSTGNTKSTAMATISLPTFSSNKDAEVIHDVPIPRSALCLLIRLIA